MQITSIEVILILAVLLTIGALIFLYFKVQKVTDSYNQLTKNVKGENLEELLKEHLKRIAVNNKELLQIKKELINFKNFSKRHLQKIGFKRFNPFCETGGNQSFILVFLNQNNNGVIISSLHQREVTRVYAKLVENGEPKNKLSKEEREILTQTLKK